MSRPLTWLAGIGLGILVVIVLAALIGASTNRNKQVSAEDWAQSVCGAVGVWRGEVEAIVEDLRTPSADAGSFEEPQSETPQGRTGLIRQGLERTVGAAETLVTGVEEAGIPETPEGDQAAELVSEWANESRDALDAAAESLDEEADSLEGSIDQLASAVAALRETLGGGARTLTAAAALDPELGKALLESSTCQQVRDETGAG